MTFSGLSKATSGAGLAQMDAALLPSGVRSRFVDGVNGLRMHVLEAGFEDPARPCVLLLHGFPEIAYSWRKVLPALAEAGYYAVAPDLRGYGRTAIGPVAYDESLAFFHMTGRLADLLCLLTMLGRDRVAALVGHDYGSWVAGYCALARPDVFRSLVLMSAPFAGAPSLVALPGTLRAPTDDPIHAALAGLARRRKHYHAYYSTRAAAADMDGTPAQVAPFLRAYFHHKSADWAENRPYTLAGWTAEALAGMPTYYIMDLERTMPETVAPEMPGDECDWLTDRELDVYAGEFARTGFQGALQGYRLRMDGSLARDLAPLAGLRVTVPSLFVAGRQDWGPFQGPGALERMQSETCADMRGCHLLDGAGHWVQQEQHEAVIRLLLGFLENVPPIRGLLI